MNETTQTRPSRLREAARGWVRLWDEREPATLMAIVRITLACVLLGDLLTIASLDLISVIYGDAEAWNMGPQFESAPQWIFDVFGRDPSVIYILFWGTVGALLMFGTGTLTRFSGIIAIVGLRTLATMYPLGDRGIDMLTRLMLVIIIFSQSHATLSVDARIRHGAWVRPNALIPAWPRYLLLTQLIWMYWSAGLNKTAGVWWWHGDYMALYYVMRYTIFVRFDLTFIPAWVTQIGSFVTMLWEYLAPLMLVAPMILRKHEHKGWRWFRRIWIATGLFFHVSLMIMLNIGIFTWAMIALYPAFMSARLLRKSPIEALRFTGERLPQEGTWGDASGAAEAPAEAAPG